MSGHYPRVSKSTGPALPLTSGLIDESDHLRNSGHMLQLSPERKQPAAPPFLGANFDGFLALFPTTFCRRDIPAGNIRQGQADSSQRISLNHMLRCCGVTL